MSTSTAVDQPEKVTTFTNASAQVVPKVGRSLSLPRSPDLTDQTGFQPVLVMSHPSMKEMASKLVQVTTSRLAKLKLENKTKATGMYRAVELWDHVEWRNFKDGWPDIFINNVNKIAGRDVILLASFHSPSVVFEQLSLIYSLPRYLIRSFRLILPFFPTGTMERIDREGQIVTAKCMASMLSGIPLSARGPAQIFIFDIHALQERFYFTDQVIPRLLSAIPLLKRELSTLENLSIAFPDEGAWKRFHTSFPEEWPTITCIKTRDGDSRMVKIKDGSDPHGRHVVIVDDMVQTGGTLIQCAVALKKAGAAKISMYTTHAVFPDKSWERFTPDHLTDGVEIDTFWITDSIPHSLEIAKVPPFKLISLCDAIASSLLSYDLTNNY